MAEFCLDCWNEINDSDYKEKDYVLSKELCLCEECGEYKHVIIAERKMTSLVIFLCILFLPFTIIIGILKFIEMVYYWVKYK